ncbi:MAG: hypothetical protein ACREFJ_00745 [Acetobacteraceae bacterium]
MSMPIAIGDDVAQLNRVFSEALLALARRGAAEDSCRLAARGWSMLRHHHPREAERLTALLHALARDTDPIHPQGDCNHE